MNRSCANFVTQRSPSRAAPAARTPCARRPASRSARGSSGSAPGSRCPAGSTAPGNGDTGTLPLSPRPNPTPATVYMCFYVLYLAKCMVRCAGAASPASPSPTSRVTSRRVTMSTSGTRSMVGRSSSKSCHCEDCLSDIALFSLDAF